MAGYEGLLTGHTLVGRYTVGEVIGRGGFAAVYEATDERLGRTVAVKVITLAADGAEAEELRRRFDREARASASLHHPNVVAVYDFGIDPKLGLDFLVMERLVGEDLRARMRRGEPLPLDAAVRVLREAADGVDAGHRIGLVHRDLKPGNVFLAQLNRPGWFRVVVVDFGIARIVAGDDTTRITHHGTPLSPAYASPEQLRGEHELTPASDVFSLGVIGYELLAGRRPFPGDRLHPPPGGFPAPPRLDELNPAVPAALADAIHRAMAEDLAERFPDAGDFAAALGRATATAPESPPVVAAPTSSDAPADTPPTPLPSAPEPASVAAAASLSPTDAVPTIPVMRTEAESPAPPPPSRPAATGASIVVRKQRRIPLAAGLVLALVIAVAAWLALRGRASGDTRAGAELAHGRGPSDSAVPAAPRGARTGDAKQDGADDVGSPGGRSPSAAPGVAPGVLAPTSAPDEPVVAPRAPAATASAPPPPRPAAPAAAHVPPADAQRAAAMNREGEEMFERGDVPGAVERFRQAVQLASANAAYRNNLAWALFNAGEADEAAAQLDAVLRLDPRRAIAYANLAEVRAARADRAGAIAAYARFLELNTDARREQIAREKLRKLKGGR